MRTDVPLKRLIALRPADLLPLFGIEGATVLGVESLELPASSTSLDSLLRLKDRDDNEYLHLVEWQGWRDPIFLWRVMGYLSWLGQNRSERPIGATLVYLQPADDVGTQLDQLVNGRPNWSMSFHSVHLWEEDAAMALASGQPGLAALSPLMAGATEDMVEQAAAIVVGAAEPEPRRADLLAILGVFAEPLIDSTRYTRMIGRERLMASDLISYLIEDKVAEVREETRRQVREETRRELREETRRELREETRQEAREEWISTLTLMVEDAIIARFPSTSISLMSLIRQLHYPRQLQELHREVLQAPDQPAVEELVRTAAQQAAQTG